MFVQTDNPSGNRVVAYHRASDGTLSPAGAYATGGLGGVLAGSVVDHLASQGSLSYDPRHAPEDLTPQQRDEFVELYRRWRSEAV